MAQSLFGLTPEQIQQARQLQQQQAINEQAKSFGMFGPLYAASRGLSQTGINALAQGLFPEAQDPALRRATTTQAIVDKYKGQNINDPDVLSNMAVDFSNAGLPDIALQVGEAASKRVKAPEDPKKQAESILLTIGQIPPEERTVAQNAMFASAQNLIAKGKEGGKSSLAERLVDLEMKKSTEGLTPKETAELTALEKVVKIQSPKGVDLTGLGEVFSKESTKAEAKQLGEDLAAIQGKQQSVESLNVALGILNDGIYTGSYGEFQKELAKKTFGAVGDLRRVENTEVFLTEVNSNVIPLLQEFGGNDSNEELKFLQRLVGGDTTLEKNAIERNLRSAIRKINKGIERTTAKGQAVRQGKAPPLPTPTTKPPVERSTKSGIKYQVIED
jgi:hypothetical protein